MRVSRAIWVRQRDENRTSRVGNIRPFGRNGTGTFLDHSDGWVIWDRDRCPFFFPGPAVGPPHPGRPSAAGILPLERTGPIAGLGEKGQKEESPR